MFFNFMEKVRLIRRLSLRSAMVQCYGAQVFHGTASLSRPRQCERQRCERRYRKEEEGIVGDAVPERSEALHRKSEIHAYK